MPLIWRTNSAGAVETLIGGFRLIVERLHYGPGASYVVGRALLPFWALVTGQRSSVCEAMWASEEIVAGWGLPATLEKLAHLNNEHIQSFVSYTKSSHTIGSERMSDQSGDILRIVYDSIVLLPFGESGGEGLWNIVSVSRSRNASLDVTGVLYFDGAYVRQVLEGPRSAVMSVFGSILCDPRHQEIGISYCGMVVHREFSTWSMAYVEKNTMKSLGSWHRSRRLDAKQVFGFVNGMRMHLQAA